MKPRREGSKKLPFSPISSIYTHTHLPPQHRVLRTIHAKDFPGRKHVFSAVEEHLMLLLASRNNALSPPELSSLKQLMAHVNIQNEELLYAHPTPTLTALRSPS